MDKWLINIARLMINAGSCCQSVFWGKEREDRPSYDDFYAYKCMIVFLMLQYCRFFKGTPNSLNQILFKMWEMPQIWYQLKEKVVFFKMKTKKKLIWMRVNIELKQHLQILLGWRGFFTL